MDGFRLIRDCDFYTAGNLSGGEVEKADVSVRVIQTQGNLRGILVGGRDILEASIRQMASGCGLEESKEAFEYLKVSAMPFDRDVCQGFCSKSNRAVSNTRSTGDISTREYCWFHSRG
jgi:hypothetical protein